MEKAFADALKKQLDSAGISGYRLGKLTGISKQTISKLLLGEVQPGWEVVQRIAKALGVSCEAFAQPIDLPDVSERRGPGRPPGTAGKAGNDMASGRQPPASKGGKRKRKAT
jgi:putative transcriptional regulator